MPTQHEIEIIAEKAAINAVKTTLRSIGIDVEDPIEAQKEFFLMREVSRMAADAEFRKDLEHVRAWRMSMDEIKSKGILVAFTIVITGILTAIWMGIKQLLNHN
jgi:hypothetical protein